MKKKKKKKKIIIGAAVVLVAAGGISVAAQRKSGEDQIPQVPVVTVQTGDVEEIVDASGTVGSEEEKTYYSPVNAQIKKVAFSQGDVVKKGTKLIEFDTKDLEKDNQKAELNLKSTKYDTKDTVNKSDKADQKQKDAKKKVQELEKKVKDKKAYVASLKSQISAATTRAQQEAAAQAAAQAAAEAQAQQAAAQAEAQKQQEIAEEQQVMMKEIQNKYQAALYTYQKETLPQYQQKLSELSSAYTQAQTAYNQADTAYQMAFAAWQADPSEENTQELSTAEENRNQAQISRDQAKEAYEDYKQQTPAMPNMADFSTDNTGSDLGFSDGTDVEDTEEEVETDTSYSGSSETVTADTSALESAMEAASDELAELQSDLASEKAIAEADSTSLTKEERKKLKVADNLSELDAKSAKELVEEGKKGITAEFNGIVSKADLKNGEAVTQGMELFTIQNTDKASVDVTLSKYDYDTVKEGQKAEITLGDNTYEGTVTRMSHIAVQNEKGTPVISATVSIDDPDDDIFLGVDAKVKIHAASAKDVVTLPVEVVNIGKDGSFCYVIENGLVTRRNITTGISSEDYIEITDGIEAGEEVISDLGDYTEGMAVQAEPQEQTGEDADE